jgi:hypothetical protein
MTDAIFAALDESLVETLDPAIYVEPKDKLPGNEDSRQAPLVAYIRKYERACRIVAIVNGAKRTRWEAAKAKREGMLSGEPDLSITWADNPTARIEMKDGQSMPTPNQIAALNWYHRRGHPVAVCRTMEGALAWLASIGAPVRCAR